MNPCRCGHSLFRHYTETACPGCGACKCPEFRHLEITTTPTDDDDDYQLRNIAG